MIGRQTIASAWILVLCLCALPATGLTQTRAPDDHVHVSIDSGPSPFSAVVYAVRNVVGTPVVIQTKQYPYVSVFDNRLQLVSDAEFEGLMNDLVALGALELQSKTGPEEMSLTYKVDIVYKGQSNSFLVTAPFSLEDLRYANIVEKVRGFVEERTGIVHFRKLGTRDEKLGLLNLRTQPPSRLIVDGVELNRESPVFNLELPEGEHTVLLVHPRLPSPEPIRFKIYAGQSTDVNLNLIPKLKAAETKASLQK